MLKRDIQGKFALKDDDYRQVRSLRLTDETWKALGIAAECLGMTRADYVEQVIRRNAHPSITREKKLAHKAKTSVVEVATMPLKVATLESLRNQVILELKLGKQSPGYKAALKALNHFIVVLNSEYTQQ
ncbi:hypothetical protein NIES2107_75840 (plasmid) [Nostoc carneum NIES-2107]|nr:hypothetical protein B4U84_15255 [Westiellopsis prolifica IICB1]BAY28276.1 hypothetical protein NIES2107_01020 [Nostoc carneum NIES-2107]TBR58661.1 hypothetical protein B4U84_22465 [Westiellopsis prolifica IICB1]TBR58983.1 hypothetical protein B4U84_24265 [Westiellopsis prolifica IICB1]TBR60728.1 hypothetical protein B4U84_07705 [Westiellopsis prolifica IICB1]